MLYRLLKLLFSLPVNLFWLKKAEGLNNIPQTGGVILISNHQGWLASQLQKSLRGSNRQSDVFKRILRLGV